MKSQSAKTTTLSLDQQIAELEQRLALRHQSARLHASALNQKVRANLSSPIALLIATGLGFGWAFFKRKAKVKPAEAVVETPVENTAEPSNKKSSDWLSNLMQIITLVEAVSLLMPSKTEVASATVDSPEEEIET